MTFSMTASRRSLCETLSLCCVEMTTVSTRTGRPSDILDGDLGFGVGAEEINFVLLADLGKLLGELMRQLDRHGHQLGSFVASVAEHHALVASAASINAHGDVGRLAFHGGHDAAGFGVKAVLGAVVANVVDHLAGNRLVIEDAAKFLLDGDFAGDDNDSPVVTSVSQPTRPMGSWVSTVSSTASEIWSAILSGWPSVTDSEVNRNFSSDVPKQCPPAE